MHGGKAEPFNRSQKQVLLSYLYNKNSYTYNRDAGLQKKRLLSEVKATSDKLY